MNTTLVATTYTVIATTAMLSYLFRQRDSISGIRDVVYRAVSGLSLLVFGAVTVVLLYQGACRHDWDWISLVVAALVWFNIGWARMYSGRPRW